MASSAQIAHDLRMQANALEGRHLQGMMLTGLCRSLRRGADEICLLYTSDAADE